MQSRLSSSRLGKPFLQISARSSALLRYRTVSQNPTTTSNPSSNTFGAQFCPRSPDFNLTRSVHDGPANGNTSNKHPKSTGGQGVSSFKRLHRSMKFPNYYSRETLLRRKQTAVRHPDHITPPAALAEYLDIKDDLQRRKYWEDIKEVVDCDSLPVMVLYHLEYPDDKVLFTIIDFLLYALTRTALGSIFPACDISIPSIQRAQEVRFRVLGLGIVRG